MKDLSIIESILRNRSAFFATILEGKHNTRLIRAMLLSSSVFLAIYGVVMGLNRGILQALSSMVKLPVLFLVTLVICAPSLHFFNILAGSKQTASQSIALSLTAITTTSVLLFSFAPITLFFLITSKNYAFYKLLNVLFFTVSGWIGVVFLRQGLNVVADSSEEIKGKGTRWFIFILWMLLYGFVGTQMAYTLSPFIGDPEMPFILFRETQSNFYTDVFDSFLMLFR
ncbi:MAG: actin-binding WH2 domain-containing protein [Anaerolineae bacterium]|nr:actin-binding WH2 domain-containing protein [Anaerolineae bacterium]